MVAQAKKEMKAQFKEQHKAWEQHCQHHKHFQELMAFCNCAHDVQEHTSIALLDMLTDLCNCLLPPQ